MEILIGAVHNMNFIVDFVQERKGILVTLSPSTPSPHCYISWGVLSSSDNNQEIRAGIHAQSRIRTWSIYGNVADDPGGDGTRTSGPRDLRAQIAKVTVPPAIQGHSAPQPLTVTATNHCKDSERFIPILSSQDFLFSTHTGLQSSLGFAASVVAWPCWPVVFVQQIGCVPHPDLAVLQLRRIKLIWSRIDTLEVRGSRSFFSPIGPFLLI